MEKCNFQETCPHFDVFREKRKKKIRNKKARKNEVCVFAIYNYGCRKIGPEWWRGKR